MTVTAVRARATLAVQETLEPRAGKSGAVDVLCFDFSSGHAQSPDPAVRSVTSRSAALRARLARWLEQPL